MGVNLRATPLLLRRPDRGACGRRARHAGLAEGVIWPDRAQRHLFGSLAARDPATAAGAPADERPRS
jgi:hypothetical protein